MDFDRVSISASQINTMMKSALKFISGEAKHVCRLCFAATDEDELDLHDSVKIQRPYIDVNVTFLTMLLDLGVELEPLLPQTLCLACGTTVMNSYLFRHLCEYSNRKWGEAMDKLEDCLKYTDTVKSYAKTIFFKIDDNLNTFARKPSKSKAEALKRFKITVSNKARYQRTKNKKKFTCEECGKPCYSTFRLKNHIAVRHNPKKLSCKLCPNTFTSLNLLNDHVEEIHDPKTHSCKQCTKMFCSERKLRIHVRDYHMAVTCKTCCIEFPSRQQMFYHASQHVKPSCPRCNKTLSRASYLRTHLKICGQTIGRQYICDICNKSYTHKNGLHTHMQSHGFGNTLTCNWCGKKCGAKSILDMHILKHTGERKFVCETCGRKFVTKKTLLNHTRLHTGEKPFPCDKCGERFISSTRRMDHIQRRHLEPSKKCPYCPAKFVGKNQHTKHVQRHLNPKSRLYVPVQRNNFVSLTN